MLIEQIFAVPLSTCVLCDFVEISLEKLPHISHNGLVDYVSPEGSSFMSQIA